MCREYKRGRRTRSRRSRAVGGRNGGARGRRREYRIERESERKTYLFVEGGSVRGCDQCEVSTCVFHSFAILSVHSALERQGLLLTPPSSTRPFLRRRVGYIPLETRENTLSFSSRDGHAAAAYGLGSWDPPPPTSLPALLFCKVLFFRNAGPTIVFPRCALAHPYRRFLQSGRVIQGLLHGRLSLPPIFRTPSTSRQIGKCAPSRIH